jgi:hypothetical protein
MSLNVSTVEQWNGVVPSHDVDLHFQRRVIIRDPIVRTVPEAAEQENC